MIEVVESGLGQSYSDKAIMEVHAKQGCSNGSIAVESPLNNLSNDFLCSGAARAIEPNSQITKCKGKHKEQRKNDCEVLHFSVRGVSQKLKTLMCVYIV